MVANDDISKLYLPRISPCDRVPFDPISLRLRSGRPTRRSTTFRLFGNAVCCRSHVRERLYSTRVLHDSPIATTWIYFEVVLPDSFRRVLAADGEIIGIGMCRISLEFR